MLKSLPPAGNPILLAPLDEPESVLSRVFGDRSVFLYGSGTMALASALVSAKKAASDRCSVASPEVLLPAYACPDLVSAALYAGLKPILVDLEANTPWMDLNRLQSQIGPNTVAVIAVHFLGIPERLKEIRSALAGSGILLIEDSAQLFPARPTERVWEGDLVILSFGRGKPVSLLGGGAVLCRNASFVKYLPLAKNTTLKLTNQRPDQLYKFKALLYNVFLSPRIYGVLGYIPFLKLGDTTFHPLEAVEPFSVNRTGLLATNIYAYQVRERKPQQWISTMLGSISENTLSDLTATIAPHFNLPLLRYPLVVKDQHLRDRLSDALINKGLGSSKMYPEPLKAIAGLSEHLADQGEFPHAEQFSQRLLTLPCHSGVTSFDVQAMKKVIMEILSE